MYRRIVKHTSTSIGNIETENTGISNFGVAPRIGFNYEHLRVAAIYNITGPDIADFFGIEVGLELGGGRR